MPDKHESVPPGMFEAKYALDDDPWNYESSEYETAKYQATLDALPRSRYANALEIGCSIGVFTAMLAPRCNRLLAIDASRLAIGRARTRCAGLANVELRVGRIPESFPDEAFDLIVLSEVGYYWSLGDLEVVRDQITHRLMPGGHLILVHWTPDIDDAPLDADTVHDLFLSSPGLEGVTGLREETYRLDVLEQSDPL